MTTTTAHRQRGFLLSLLTLLSLAGAFLVAPVDVSASTRVGVETRVRAIDHPTTDLVAANTTASPQGVGVFGLQLRQLVSATGVATEAAESGTALARRLGSEGEALAGIDQAAKVRIPSATNSASYRIPDALTETTLTEVKNVARQGFTPQLQDFTYYATQTGRRFDLIIRENTVLTRELEDIVNMTGSPINVIRGLPAK